MPGKQKTILVLEDDPDIIEFLQYLLEQEGYTIAHTDNVGLLKGLYDGNLPDLILLDVFLSGADGRAIARHLKSQEQSRHIPVIMFSAHPHAEETTREAGADDFIAKPFEIDDLLATLKKWL